MDRILVRGGARLTGEVEIGGAKNAALPIMAATLLAPGVFELTNVPSLVDVSTMGHVLRVLGAQVTHHDHSLTIDTTNCSYHEAPYELVKTMRASVCVLGPVLARQKRARVSLPGGCAWGPRPVDFHIRAMKALGADVEIEHGYIVASADRLTGSVIHFDTSSVGATENAMMAATLAEGTTTIENAAREPEITALADFLNAMGAQVAGAGTATITIEGVDDLHAVEFRVVPDRIEAGTFLIAGALAGDEIVRTHVRPADSATLIERMTSSGVEIERLSNSSLKVKGCPNIKPQDITTSPYPGFPTDMQAQFTVLMTQAEGTSIITETIFDRRFSHVNELLRLGAVIEVMGDKAIVRGRTPLSGAETTATDLRASASLVLAGLIASGETIIIDAYHLDRGYEKIAEKLNALGAHIERFRE